MTILSLFSLFVGILIGAYTGPKISAVVRKRQREAIELRNPAYIEVTE